MRPRVAIFASRSNPFVERMTGMAALRESSIEEVQKFGTESRRCLSATTDSRTLLSGHTCCPFSQRFRLQQLDVG